MDFQFQGMGHDFEQLIYSQVAARTGKGLDAGRAAYHKAMAAKYEWASTYPWLPVAPDPPEPR